MLTTESAIFRLRRDLVLGVVVRTILLVATVGSFVFLPRLIPQLHSSVPLIGAVVIWVALSYSSAKTARLTAETPNLIAAGRFDEAERKLNDAVRAFSVLRGPKLLMLAQLAELRHAQERYADCAALCSEVLAHRGSEAAGQAITLRFLLADSMLELNDLRGAHAALSVVANKPLPLADVLRLLFLQLSYEARIGAWQRMFHDVMTKVRLAELMPSSPSAAVQALLALAARHVGREDFSQWLRLRAELLVASDKIVEAQPIVAPLWPAEQAQLAGGQVSAGGAI